MGIIEKLNEATKLIKEAAGQLEKETSLELEFEIKIKPQLPTIEVFEAIPGEKTVAPHSQ